MFGMIVTSAVEVSCLFSLDSSPFPWRRLYWSQNESCKIVKNLGRYIEIHVEMQVRH